MECISDKVKVTRINASVDRGGWQCILESLRDTDLLVVNQNLIVPWRGAFGNGLGSFRTAFNGHVVPSRFQFDKSGSTANFIAETTDGYLRRGWVQGIGFAEVDARTHYHQFSDDDTECRAEPMGYEMTMGKLIKHILGYEDTCCDVPPAYLTFDANNDYVTCGSNVVIDNLPAANILVLDGWVRATGPGKGNRGRIIAKGTSYTAGWTFGVDIALGLIAHIECATQDAVAASGVLPFIPLIGQWVYVLAYYDPGGDRIPRLNINGHWLDAYAISQDGQGAYSGDGALTLYLGCDNAFTGADPDYVWQGDLGWQRISSYAAAPARFTPGTDFVPPLRCALPANDADTVGTWIYEGVGTTADNYQGNPDIDGTIMSGAAPGATWGCDCDSVWVAHTNLVQHPTLNPHGWVSLVDVETTPFAGPLAATPNPDGTMTISGYIVRETDNLWSKLQEIARNEFFVIYFDKTNTLHYTKHPMYRTVVPTPVMTFDENFCLTPPVVEPLGPDRVRQIRLHAVQDDGTTLHSDYPVSPTHVYGKVNEISRIRCNDQTTLDDWAYRTYLYETRDYTVRWSAPGLCGLLFEILDRVQITYSGTDANGVHLNWVQKKFWIHDITVTPDAAFSGRTDFVLEAENA